VTASRQSYARRHPRRQRPSRARRLLLLLVIVAAFATGTALGVALEQGSGAKGMQTRERTLRIVTVTVSQP
jgi:hypothetical protein